MPIRLRNYSKTLISVCLILTFCLVEGEAQTKKKKRTRRSRPAAAQPVITNPTVAPPATTATTDKAATGDVKIISTADSTTTPTESDSGQGWKPKVTTPPPPTEEDDMKATITGLTNQVNKLNDKLSKMQEDDRYQLDMERLTRAEQRAEQLRMQLIDVQSKIADLESKLEQVEYALKPENIDRATQGYGSTRPEEARDTRRKQLESERARLIAQLKILQTSQNRLEVSVQNADAEVDMLRAKLQMRRDAMESQPRKP
jgi:hypothetical protein